MNKVLKFIFLIIIFWVFLVRIANAQGFWVKFIDGNEDRLLPLLVNGYSHNTIQTYYIGVATIDHKTIYDPLLKISPEKINLTYVNWYVKTPGESLIYDVYLTSNSESNIYYWTSQGHAFGKSLDYNTIIIDWSKIGVNVKIAFTHLALRDDIQITAVPIPSALWLLGSGVITLGLIRKKLLTC